MSSPPHVQEQVLLGFQPKREGEADYSALIITFTKKCRGAPPQAGLAAGMGHAVQDLWAPSNKGGSLASSGRTGSWASSGKGGSWGGKSRTRNIVDSSGGLDPGGGYWAGAEPDNRAPQHTGGDQQLEAFRSRFPMDDRAFAYLSESPPSARRRVIEAFHPKFQDTDYSAPVIAFAKKCRGNGPGAMANQGASWHDDGPTAHGYGSHDPPAGYRAPLVQSTGHESFMTNLGHRAPRFPSAGYAAAQHTGPDQYELDAFVQKYPVDERAYAYLSESPPDVLSRVLNEFKPKREGESDYSGIVVAYVKRCRNDGGFSGKGGEPNAKRARYA